MFKILLPLLLLILLSLACGGSSKWQPDSGTAPRFEAALPEFLIQGEEPGVWPPRNSLIRVDAATGVTNTQIVDGAGNLAALLAGEYRLVGSVLLSQQDQIYTILGGQVSPDGLWTAQQREGGLVLRRVDDAGMLTLSANGRSPVWSPDGQWLAYHDDNGLWAVSMDNLAVTPLLATGLEPLAWSADNSQLLLRDGQTALILDMAAQSQRPLTGVEAGQIHGRPVWSPDGQLIYARYGDNGRLDLTTAHNQPDDMLARLVAITTVNSRSPIRNLLPADRDQGVILFWLSPDGSAIMAHHFFCASQRSGLIPLLSVRNCEGRLVAVATGTGHYATIWQPPSARLGDAGWERPLPPVNLADLPLPPEPIPAP